MPVYFPSALGIAAAMAWFAAFSADDFASRWQYLIASAGALIFLSFRRTISFKFCLVLLAIALLFFAYAQFSKPAPSENDLSKFNGLNAVIRVELSEDPKPFGKNAFSCLIAPVQIIFPRSSPLSGNAQLIFSNANQINFQRGDFLEVKASLRPPENPVEPWKFQTKDFLSRQAIFCIATTKSDCAKLPSRKQSFWTSLINQSIDLAGEKRRTILLVHTANIGTTYAALLQSIVLGDKSTTLPKDLKSDFRHVGLSHITAASGFNLTVVVGITYWIAKLFCKTGALTRILPLASILVFVLMAGPSPSVVRAALCCATVLLSSHLRRKFSPLSVLSLSLFLSVTFDPILATDVGAELSYAATFGIICWAKSLRARGAIENEAEKRVDFAAASRWFWDSLVILLGVQVCVLPIQLTYFWQTGLAFLPANLIAEPLIAPLTVAGFVSSFLAALANSFWAPPLLYLAYWIDQFACLLIKFLLLVVDEFNHFPYAVINIGPPTGSQTFTYYMVLLFVLHYLKKGWHIVPATIVYLFALGLLLYRPPLSQPIICASHEFLGLVGVDRKGFYNGAPQETEKFLAYYGCCAAIPIKSTQRGATPPLPIYDGIRTRLWKIFLPEGAVFLDPVGSRDLQIGGEKNQFCSGNCLQLTLKDNRRYLHSRQLKGDQKYPFTLFCSRGLTADFTF